MQRKEYDYKRLSNTGCKESSRNIHDYQIQGARKEVEIYKIIKYKGASCINIHDYQI